MLNWAIIKEPLNWLTFFLMTAIAIIAINFLTSHIHSNPSDTASDN